ncbi:unnamed protein product [Euphydryas editha]|uniref:Uncharacterized protein n=1 Tax=Euphydryas editha TaxID=104508 RepID=A0AAU9UY49_EUPED|nr:unnamed protein product [Euphydryas editha]
MARTIIYYMTYTNIWQEQKWLSLTAYCSDPSAFGKVENVECKKFRSYLDSYLSWTPQVSELSRELFAAIRSLRWLKYFLLLSIKIALAQLLLLPILNYADTCFFDFKEEQLTLKSDNNTQQVLKGNMSERYIAVYNTIVDAVESEGQNRRPKIFKSAKRNRGDGGQVYESDAGRTDPIYDTGRDGENHNKRS